MLRLSIAGLCLMGASALGCGDAGSIGAGGHEPAPFIVDSMFGRQVVYQPVEIDEGTLKEIAQRTGGRYFRAEDEEALEKIYGEIDGLEKTEITSDEYVNYTDLFGRFLLPAALLLLFEGALSATVLRRFP